MAGDERQLRYELLDAARGETPRTDFWKKDQAFDSYFSGVGSQNIWLLRFATQALRGKPVPWEAVYHYQLGPPPGFSLAARGGAPVLISDPAGTDRVYTPGFGGSEFMSTIYWVWHLMSHMALIRKGGSIGERARRWVVLNWVLFRAIQAPDGSLMLFGQRSAGHNPIPREPDWLFARASDGDVGRAERWCKQAGAGLKRGWEFEIGNELLPEMRATYQESLAIAVEDLPKLLTLRAPTDIVKTTEGIAVVHSQNCNPNTPPILAGTLWRDGRRDILPTSMVKSEKVPGGIRIRQRFDRATARIEGGEIVYASSLFTDGAEQRIPLPGGEVKYHLKLGRGDAAPVPVEPAEPTDTIDEDPSKIDDDPSAIDLSTTDPTATDSTTTTEPTTTTNRDLARAAALIAGLQLPRKQKALQDELVAKLLASPGDADVAAILVLVRTFGIGPGQPQAVQWREAQAILEG